MYSALLPFFVCISIVYCSGTANLRFFFSSNDDYTEMPIETAHNIFKLTWYNASRNTVIFAHGFTGYPQGPAVTAVIESYLEQGESNVALLNWQEMASANYSNNKINSYIKWAAPNAKKLGYLFADTLLNMSASGFDLKKTHLVGHSLGAHIFGIAGNTLLSKDVQLPWITGLDPASAGFENRPASSRLNPGSAEFVSVIHSDPSKYGYKRSLGTVDFWPNYKTSGLVIQPGCENKRFPMFSLKDLCNHNRCWQLLVDSIQYPGSIIGSYAKSYRKWKNSSKGEREEITLELGVYKKEPVPGDYFFTTASKSPYGLGKDGL